MKNWRDTACLPKNTDAVWRARDNWCSREVTGWASIQRVIKRWHPFSAWMVATPHNPTYLPLLHVDALKTQAYRSFNKRNLLTMLCLITTAGLCGAINLTRPTAGAVESCNAALVILQFALVDYLLVTGDVEKLRERALFAVQARLSERGEIAKWGSVMLFAAVSQLLCGDVETALMKYGAVFSKLSNGELWRLITGPFIHDGIAHWGSNLVMLCIAGITAGAISRAHTAAVFLAACIASFAATWLLNYSHDEAIAGVSGGIFGIAGYISGAALRYPRLFPRHFAWTCLHFNLMDLYLAHLLNAGSSLTAHASGLLVGVLWGLLCRVEIDLPHSGRAVG